MVRATIHKCISRKHGFEAVVSEIRSKEEGRQEYSYYVEQKNHAGICFCLYVSETCEMEIKIKLTPHNNSIVAQICEGLMCEKKTDTNPSSLSGPFVLQGEFLIIQIGTIISERYQC
jgi:hypothetical protein